MPAFDRHEQPDDRAVIREQSVSAAGWLEAAPDLTQQELADRFTSETGRPVSQRPMSRVLGRMRQTLKK